MRQQQSQRLSEAEFESLIGVQVTDSIESFSKLTYFATGDTCTPAQYLRIVSIMYGLLDPNKIPSGTIVEDFPSEDLDLTLAALIGLGVTLPVWLNNRGLWTQLTKGLSAHWPDIRRWIVYLYKTTIIQYDLNTSIRSGCKTAVVEFLGLVRDRLLMSWSKTIVADREMMRIVSDLWFIETRDARFSSWSAQCNTQRESAVFNSCFLIAHESGIQIDWDNILVIFHKEPEVIATIALCHLDREISRSNGPVDINCIAWDIHIASTLTLHEGIRIALMRQGLIKAASEILYFAVDRRWTGDIQVHAARCMVNALVVLRTRLEDMDALPFILQAIQWNLIPSLLKCERLMPFADPPAAQCQPIIIVGEILVGYTVYRSVLHPLARAIDAATAEKLDLMLTRGGELHRAWKRLKDAVEERRRLVRRDVANGHIQTCQNDECSRMGHMSRFKRCAGCLHAYYCSLECQRYDWQIGKHKEYCTRVHQRALRTCNERMSAVHSKDLKFLGRVILAELKKHHARLSAHPLAKLTLVDLNLVGGQSSHATGAATAVFDARGMNANPFGIKCACEMYTNARWKRLAEIVRESKAKRPIVLVRAFISGGCARKIVLQAIPLSAVVGEGGGDADDCGVKSRHPARAPDRCLFNLIFTCCGSEGSEAAKEFTRGFKGMK